MEIFFKDKLINNKANRNDTNVDLS